MGSGGGKLTAGGPMFFWSLGPDGWPAADAGNADADIAATDAIRELLLERRSLSLPLPVRREQEEEETQDIRAMRRRRVECNSKESK